MAPSPPLDPRWRSAVGAAWCRRQPRHNPRPDQPYAVTGRRAPAARGRARPVRSAPMCHPLCRPAAANRSPLPVTRPTRWVGQLQEPRRQQATASTPTAAPTSQCSSSSGRGGPQAHPAGTRQRPSGDPLQPASSAGCWAASLADCGPPTPSIVRPESADAPQNAHSSPSTVNHTQRYIRWSAACRGRAAQVDPTVEIMSVFTTCAQVTTAFGPTRTPRPAVAPAPVSSSPTAVSQPGTAVRSLGRGSRSW